MVPLIIRSGWDKYGPRVAFSAIFLAGVWFHSFWVWGKLANPPLSVVVSEGLSLGWRASNLWRAENRFLGVLSGSLLGAV